MKALAWMTQFGLNMVTPIVLCIIVAAWLKNKFNIGDWIIIAAVVIGVGSSFVNMFSFIKTVKKENGRKNDDEEHTS
jgi:F0F1-type ATP synthase assembly protein I